MNEMILFLQTFGIILVVMGHSGEKIPYLTKWIYSFHMPLFVFISGYLFEYTDKKYKENTREFLIKKIKRLILPYILISSCAYLPKLILNKFAQRKLELSLSSYINGIIYPWQNPIIFFWFLPTLFIIFLITLIIKKSLIYNKKIEVVLLVAFIIKLLNSFAIKFLNISGVLDYYFFFILGIYYCKNEKEIGEKLKVDNINCLLISFLFTIINLFLEGIIPDLKILDIFFSVFGILFGICLAKLYLKNKISLINHLYGYSFTIYLLSWFPQVFVRIFGFQILKLHWGIVLPISTFLGIYIPYFIGKILKSKKEKNKKIRFIASYIGI